MPKHKFRADSNAIDTLSKAQDSIDKYSPKHPNEFSEKEHSEFRRLLKERTDAFLEATGMKIHSLFEY